MMKDRTDITSEVAHNAINSNKIYDQNETLKNKTNANSIHDQTKTLNNTMNIMS